MRRIQFDEDTSTGSAVDHEWNSIQSLAELEIDKTQGHSLPSNDIAKLLGTTEHETQLEDERLHSRDLRKSSLHQHVAIAITGQAGLALGMS